MSASSSNQDQTSRKSLTDEKITLKKSKTKLSASQTQAGTSSSEPDESQNEQEDKTWAGFFPPNMWFWKPEEPQGEIQIKNWSMNSQLSINHNNEERSQQLVKKTDSEYIWPNTINIMESQRLANQPTLDQIIEQRKLRENQLIFAQDFSKHVDYLGDRLSKTKLNILIAQLNNILPSISQEEMDTTKKLNRSKPLRVKRSSSRQLRRKLSERLSPEDIAQREQLRKNQLQEYENIRDQIGLFGEVVSFTKLNISNVTLNESSGNAMEETISKTDLNKLVDILNEMPDMSKKNMDTLEKLIQSKPRIVEILRQVHKKTTEASNPEEIARQEQLRQNQIQEVDNLRDHIAFYEESSASTNVILTNLTTENINRSVIEETISKTELKQIVSQLDKPLLGQESLRQIRSKTSKTAERAPEDIAKWEQLRENQLQEYENLRDQIGLFGEKRSVTDVHFQDRKEIFLEETISERDLNLFFNQLNGKPLHLKTFEKGLQRRRTTEHLTREQIAEGEKFKLNQKQEFEDLCNKNDVFGENRSQLRLNASDIVLLEN